MLKLDSNVTGLATGQADIKIDVKAIVGKQAQLETSVAALNAKLASLEKEISSISQAKADICNLQHSIAVQSASTETMLSRLDDIENRSRLCNLIFHGIPDEAGESWDLSEQKNLNFAVVKLGVTLNSSQIERAHRLGRYSPEKNRPIMASLSSYKTKNQLLLCGPKLRGLPLSISEDFPNKVRIARQRILAFAKSKKGQYKLRFDGLHMGSNVFIYDPVSNSVVNTSA